MPRVVAYQLVEGAGAPKAIAFHIEDGKFLPVYHAAATPEAAIANANAWWDAEVAKQANMKPRGRPKKAAAAPVADQPSADEVEDTV